MPGVAAEPVKFPDDDFVTLAEAIQHSLQFGQPGFGSTDSVVSVDPFTPGSFQFPDLQLGVLVRGAHSGVSPAAS